MASLGSPILSQDRANFFLGVPLSNLESSDDQQERHTIGFNNLLSCTKKRKFEDAKHDMEREIQLTCDDTADSTSIYLDNVDQTNTQTDSCISCQILFDGKKKL